VQNIEEWMGRLRLLNRRLLEEEDLL